MCVKSVSDVTQSFDMIETGLRNIVGVFVKCKIVVQSDTKKFNVIRQRDS